MDKEHRTKKKELDARYYDYYGQVKKSVRQKNLNLYAQRETECILLDKMYESFKNGEKYDKSLGKDKEKTIEKITKGKPKKTVAEIVSDTVFLFSMVMSIVTLFLYIMNFIAGNEESYNEGITMYYQAGTYVYVVIFAFIMFAVFFVMNKISMNMKTLSCTQIVNLIFIVFFGILAIILYALGNTVICFNFLIMEGVFVFLAAGGYFFSRWSYKKHYQEYLEKRNIQKEIKE